MHKKCSNCQLVNYADAANCLRCEAELIDAATIPVAERRGGKPIMNRVIVCFCVCFAVVIGFYFSLVVSAEGLDIEQKATVRRAIRLLREKGFSDEAMLLDNFTIYRSNDNWLNASVAKESAYAATNFPFAIMTLYSDFFAYPEDDVERAAILLHESKHLQGEDEAEAYTFVWKNRKVLGWTRDNYLHSPVWMNVRRQTREDAPELFTCLDNEFGDCTE